MVVVAIIGILAAVAVPSIGKYMAKAKQSEAKTNLGSLYSSNKIFFTEHQVYDNKFLHIGFQPDGKLRYNVGWEVATGALDSANLASYGYGGFHYAASFNTEQFCVGGSTGCTKYPDMPTNPEGPGATPPCNSSIDPTISFVACASGRIYQAYEDVWRIDATKTLSNPLDATTQ